MSVTNCRAKRTKGCHWGTTSSATCSTTSTTASTSSTARGAYSFWNRAAEILSGYSAEEVVGSFCSAEILRIATGPAVSCATGHAHSKKRLTLVSPVVGACSCGTRTDVGSPWMCTRCRCGCAGAGLWAAWKSSGDASSVIALEDAYKKVRELAHKDPLTGVANRRSMDGLLQDQVATFTRTGIHFSVILCDIDHFKHVNDKWGHPAGDAALQSFAACLQERVRRNDLVARFGGEEFMVLMPGSRLEGAEKLAERFRCAVARSRARCPGRRAYYREFRCDGGHVQRQRREPLGTS